MVSGPDHDTRILDAALRLAAREGWRAASLAAIAAEAGVSLLDVYRRYPSRVAILAGLIDRADQAVLRGRRPDSAESARDRLFDVLMRRFDALKPHKDGFSAIARALSGDPASVACLSPRFLRSMGWMLEVAGLDSSGWRGALQRKGLAAIYLAGMRAWLSDDTADSSRTMVAVDRALRRAESAMGWCSRFGSNFSAGRTDGIPETKVTPDIAVRKTRARRKRR
jgi:AcrR family transcriptional regulator